MDIEAECREFLQQLDMYDDFDEDCVIFLHNLKYFARRMYNEGYNQGKEERGTPEPRSTPKRKKKNGRKIQND